MKTRVDIDSSVFFSVHSQLPTKTWLATLCQIISNSLSRFSSAARNKTNKLKSLVGNRFAFAVWLFVDCLPVVRTFQLIIEHEQLPTFATWLTFRFIDPSTPAPFPNTQTDQRYKFRSLQPHLPHSTIVFFSARKFKWSTGLTGQKHR